MHSYRNIVEHLLYHKAILDTDVDVDYYLRMVKNMEDGIHIIATNPVDKAISIIFELVTKEKLDPWKIDLVKFVNLYLDRIRKEKDIDFIIAGKIIYMAWNILHRKSEDVLYDAERDEYPDDFFGFDIDIGNFQIYESDEKNEKFNVNMEIKEPVRREEKRPVSLFELIEAINEARVEYETRKRRRKIREKFKFNLEEKVHREDLEEEIKEVWERIAEVMGDEISLTLLYDGTRDDFIKVFISLLFLEKYGKVELYQKRAYGDINVKILIPQELRSIEFAAVPNIDIVNV